MILGRGDKRVGLAVDRLAGQQEVVIKALDPAVSGAAFGMAGATIMGDGRVVLILDSPPSSRSAGVWRGAMAAAAG